MSAPIGLPVEVAREQLTLGRELSFLAGGSSMWPSMAPGRAVNVSSCAPEHLQVGCCVLVVQEQELVLHRVVGADRQRVLLKGDNNRTPDGWYAREEILGRLPGRRFDRVFALLSRMPGQPIPCLWAIWRRVF
jgi:hypothetical protein